MEHQLTQIVWVPAHRSASIVSHSQRAGGPCLHQPCGQSDSQTSSHHVSHYMTHLTHCQSCKRQTHQRKAFFLIKHESFKASQEENNGSTLTCHSMHASPPLATISLPASHSPHKIHSAADMATTAPKASCKESSYRARPSPAALVPSSWPAASPRRRGSLSVAPRPPSRRLAARRGAREDVFQASGLTSRRLSKMAVHGKGPKTWQPPVARHTMPQVNVGRKPLQ